jgi:hypothetical protein
MRNMHKTLVQKPGEKRPLRRVTHTRVNYIEIDVRGVGYEDVN